MRSHAAAEARRTASRAAASSITARILEHVLSHRLQHLVAVAGTPQDKDSLRVVDLELIDYERIHELMATYADLRVGFVDYAVLAVVDVFRAAFLSRCT